MIRRLGAAYDWFDERTAIRSLLRKGLYEAVPVRGAWFYTLGSATLVLILLQLITGIFLTLLYVPSVTEAWSSLNYLKEHDAFGSIVRGIHLWSAYILLFVIGLHMIRTFFSGSYKRPRELNWVTGVGLFVLVLAMAITGAFLPWDQAAYWTAVAAGACTKLMVGEIQGKPHLGDFDAAELDATHRVPFADRRPAVAA